MLQLTKQVWVNPVKKKHGTELKGIRNGRPGAVQCYNDDDKSGQSGLKNTRYVKISRACSHSLNFHSSPVAIHNIWRQVNKKKSVWIVQLVYRNRNKFKTEKCFSHWQNYKRNPGSLWWWPDCKCLWRRVFWCLSAYCFPVTDPRKTPWLWRPIPTEVRGKTRPDQSLPLFPDVESSLRPPHLEFDSDKKILYFNNYFHLADWRWDVVIKLTMPSQVGVIYNSGFWVNV